ncbi:MAG: hypothetical protein K6E79_04480, partial [Pseudobutyrivibrio sp.]|nr:hypothetical protein [Pseudobutyrivibrio sp.]
AQLDDFFASGIPEADEIAMLEDTDRDLDVHERALRGLTADFDKTAEKFSRTFEKGIPEDSEFGMWNKMASNLAELRAKAEHSKLSEDTTKQLTELKFFFDKMVPTDEQLAHVERQATQITRLEDRISISSEKLMALKAERDANVKITKKKGPSVWSVLGLILFIIFMLSGLVFTNYISNDVGQIVEVVSFAAAFVDLVLMVIFRRRSYSNQNRIASEYEEDIEEAEEELEMAKLELREVQEDCDEFLSNFLLTRADTVQENVYEIRRKLDQYQHLLDEEKARHSESEGTLDELADIQLELYTKIQPYASFYGINLYEMGGEYDFLSQLKKDADKYAKYLEVTDEITRHENKIKVMMADIDKVLKRYPVDKEKTRSEQIQEISARRKQYDAIAERIEGLKESIAQFEANYDVNEQVQSVDDLQNAQNEIDEQIVELNKQIMQDKENLSGASAEIERLGDVAEQLDRLTETESEYKKRADLLKLTEDFLQKARESFLSKYMQPLQNGLHKYLSLIDGPDGTKSGYAIDDFELDMDLNIKLSYSGSTKSADYLSQGYQDLVALCSRLALVDVLYAEEKPILILDDPFTNLDDKKIKESLKLLEKISKDRQIIYFTCHDSRL